MKMVFWIIFIVWVSCKLGQEITFPFTNFIPPKGVLRLVPFRVSGWRSDLFHRDFKINWVWEKINYDEV